MSDNHAITVPNLLATLPAVLAADDNMAALAAAVARILAERPEEIRALLIYSRISSLPEELLDILAYDFKVDWWDPDYNLAQKRRTLEESWYVHRILGTKAAVQRAISSVYPDSTVQEWFDYDGKPYHFRLTIDTTNEAITAKKRVRLLARLNYYKNLRSHLDGIRYYAHAETETHIHAGVTYIGECETYTVYVPKPKWLGIHGTALDHVGVRFFWTMETVTVRVQTKGGLNNGKI